MPNRCTPRSKQLVYYGPHLCPKGCGGMVVMTAYNSPTNFIFDAPHDIVYPNHVYKRHRCKGGPQLPDGARINSASIPPEPSESGE